MKYPNIQNKIKYFMTCAMGMMFILTGCSSSDDAVQVLADQFIAIRGQITSTAIRQGR